MKTTQLASTKKNNWIKTTLYLLIISTSIITWVWLIMAGYVPNYLNLELLSPDGRHDLDISNFPDNSEPAMAYKPVIYLYPTRKQNVQVRLDFNGTIIADYPKYNENLRGWSVTAHPDGTLINHDDNKEYNYLFWEGKLTKDVDWDFSKGFVVKGEDTVEFLQQILPKIGLIPREYNEFIVFWYPHLKDNPYNLIHFCDKQYTDIATLTTTPKPNSILRVFMVYKPLEKQIVIEEQEIQPFERKGFAVVEWGGTKAE